MILVIMKKINDVIMKKIEGTGQTPHRIGMKCQVDSGVMSRIKRGKGFSTATLSKLLGLLIPDWIERLLK